MNYRSDKDLILVYLLQDKPVDCCVLILRITALQLLLYGCSCVLILKLAAWLLLLLLLLCALYSAYVPFKSSWRLYFHAIASCIIFNPHHLFNQTQRMFNPQRLLYETGSLKAWFVAECMIFTNWRSTSGSSLSWTGLWKCRFPLWI